jgi:hypothetical protein
MFSAIGTFLADSTVLEEVDYSSVSTSNSPILNPVYDKYMWLIADYMPDTDFTNLYIRMKLSSSASFDTGSNYAYAGRGIRDDGTLTNAKLDPAAFIRTNINGIGGVSGGFTNEGLSGYIFCSRPQDSDYTHVFWEYCYRNSFNQTYYCYGGGQHQSANPVNQLQIYSSSGTHSLRAVFLGKGNGE